MTSPLAQLLESLAAKLPAGRVSRLTSASAHDSDPPEQASLKGDFDAVSAALAAIPNSAGALSYDEWVGIAAAVRGACQDDPHAGLELFQDFSDRGALPPGEEGDNPERVYWSLQAPFKAGAGTLYRLAEKHGWTGRAAAEGWFDAEAAAMAPETDPVFPADEPARTLNIISSDEAAETALTHSAEPLIDGLLDQNTLSVVFGDSNAGKTFVVLDMLWSEAEGSEWAGLRTAGLGVLYVAAEGSHGIRKRVAALRSERGRRANFDLLIQPINLYDAEADLWPLIAAVKAAGYGIVVLDTLNLVMAGGDENSSVDMGVLIKHAKWIQVHAGAHVMIIHHTGKDAARGARGHSSLRAALDTEIEVISEGPGFGRVQVTKQRDMEMGFETKFELRDRILGVDGRGRVVKSATVHLSKEVRANREPSQMEQWIIDVLREHDTGEGMTAPTIAAQVALVYNAKVKSVAAIVGAMAKPGGKEFLRRSGNLYRLREDRLPQPTPKISVFD